MPLDSLHIFCLEIVAYICRFRIISTNCMVNHCGCLRNTFDSSHGLSEFATALRPTKVVKAGTLKKVLLVHQAILLSGGK